MTNQFRRMKFEELEAAVQDVLRARMERLGYLGEFFQIAGVQPHLLAPFMRMTEALKEALPDRLTEVGALTVACLMGNNYELHQHERLSKKLGFREEWIKVVEKLSPSDATEMKEDERLLQRFVIAMVERRGQNVGAELSALTKALGSEQAVAIMFLVGRYITHALFVNSLELEPPVPSIFEDLK